jgi:hypothetical protein
MRLGYDLLLMLKAITSYRTFKALKLTHFLILSAVKAIVSTCSLGVVLMCVVSSLGSTSLKNLPSVETVQVGRGHVWSRVMFEGRVCPVTIEHVGNYCQLNMQKCTHPSVFQAAVSSKFWRKPAATFQITCYCIQHSRTFGKLQQSLH